jgi:hypothetical protein
MEADGHAGDGERRRSPRRKLAAAVAAAAVIGAVALPVGVFAAGSETSEPSSGRTTESRSDGGSSLANEQEHDGDCPRQEGQENDARVSI